MTHLGFQLFFLTLLLLCHFLGGFCEPPESLQFDQEFLLLLRDWGAGGLDDMAVFPPEILQHTPSEGSRSCGSKPGKVRKRGRRGGGLQRLKSQGHWRIPLPSVILANSQSLLNKIDILQANVHFLP